VLFRFLSASFYRRNPRSLGRSPRGKAPAFPPLRTHEYTNCNGKTPITRVSWSSSHACFTFLRVLSYFFFCFLLFFTVCDRKEFDGPRGDFLGRRGPTEGASHTRLGHEPRPSDLLKISIAFAPLALPHQHDVRPKQAHHRRYYSHHCTRSFLLFFTLAFLPLSLQKSSRDHGTGERHSHTYTHIHTHTRARTHTHTHTHTHEMRYPRHSSQLKFSFKKKGDFQ